MTRPIDFEISEAREDGTSLFDLYEADETSDPLMQLLYQEANDAGIDFQTYLFN